MGGDNSPTKTIKGIDLFVKKNTSKMTLKLIYLDEAEFKIIEISNLK